MKRYFALGFVLAIVLVGCSSFAFDRFGLNLQNTIALSTLLHHDKPAKDLPLKRCGLQNGQFTCVVMFADEFYQMKTEYEQCHKRLESCEKTCN